MKVDALTLERARPDLYDKYRRDEPRYDGDRMSFYRHLEALVASKELAEAEVDSMFLRYLDGYPPA